MLICYEPQKISNCLIHIKESNIDRRIYRGTGDTIITGILKNYIQQHWCS